MSVIRVLSIADNEGQLSGVPDTVSVQQGTIQIDRCESREQALELIQEHDYEAILPTLAMMVNGFREAIREARPDTPLVVVLEPGEHTLAAEALGSGAYDVVIKPIDSDQLAVALGRAIQVRQLLRTIQTQRTQLERKAGDLDRAVEERVKELREANRIKDEFLATLSHELRTPLNSILGWAQLLRKGTLDEDTARRAINTIERSTKSLNEIIGDLLEVSRIVTGKFKLQVGPVRLGRIIEAALDAVRPALAAKGIHLQLSLDPDVGVVSGDPSRLQQVVWNLLSNAIKFTPPGGRVKVMLEKVGEDARITVEDSGEGIDPAFLPYVFDRFAQADSTFARKHGGLGLGLAIVRHLVEMHGGRVSAESSGIGNGAAFRISIPTLNAWALRNEYSHLIPPEKTTGPLTRRTLQGLRILVVDDEADARELLTEVLEQRGARVIAVGSAHAALETLAELGRSLLPHVLISDIGMPGQDGFELIHKVRTKFGSHKRIPAIALTAYARPEDRERVLAAGYDLHIAKPVEASELVKAVQKVIEANRSESKTVSQS
jgi:signal transduction histidine kinase